MLFAEDGGGAVLDEGVRPADADDGGGDAGGAELLDHGAAETVHEDVIFKRADDLHFFGDEAVLPGK